MAIDKKYWFHAKRYGWGWGTPASWQGWLVLIMYGALIGGGVHFFLEERRTIYFCAYVGAVSVTLVAVCWLKGEPPRWRWGND